jgi:hypothetical protein
VYTAQLRSTETFRKAAEVRVPPNYSVNYDFLSGLDQSIGTRVAHAIGKVIFGGNATDVQRKTRASDESVIATGLASHCCRRR